VTEVVPRTTTVMRSVMQQRTITVPVTTYRSECDAMRTVYDACRRRVTWSCR
jgi:hypothetical protein